MHVKGKGFMKTLEAVIAGLLLLSYMMWFSAKPVEVKGLEAKNYRLYATLLMASLHSNVSDVLLKADEDSASELLRELSGTEVRMRFYLKEIPRKEIEIGYLLNPDDKKEVSVSTSSAVPCSSTADCKIFGSQSTCVNFTLGSHKLYFVNESFIALLNSSGQCDGTSVMVGEYFNYSQNEFYSFARMIETSPNTYELVFLNQTNYVFKFYEPHKQLFDRFYLNGKEIHISFIPVTYDMLTLDLDALLIVNRTDLKRHPEEMDNVLAFLESGGGILLVANVDGSTDSDVLKLLGLQWNGTASGPDGSDSIFLDILKTTYVKGYEFVEFFEHAYYPVHTDYLNLAPGVNVSCITYSGNIFTGNLTVRSKVYPFIVVNGTPSPYFDTIYVSRDGDLDFCDSPLDSTPIKEKDTFVLQDGGVTNEVRLEKITGFVHYPPVYFTFTRDHRFRDMSLAIGTGENRIVPVKNDTTRMIIHSEMEWVGRTFPAPVLILQEINNTYRAGWLTSDLKGDDEWKVLRDAVLWVARKVPYAALRDVGYSYSITFPVAWVNETKLMGIAELRVW